MTVAILAIDPSLTGFALAMWRDGSIYESEHSSKPAKSVACRVDRYVGLANHAADIAPRDTRLILIEGYSFGSKGRAVYGLGEFGGVLRFILRDAYSRADIVEVPPSVLKKFATGKGNANKVAVATALTKRYGREFASDNQADAFALLQLGMCATGQAEPSNAYMRDAADTVAATRFASD